MEDSSLNQPKSKDLIWSFLMGNFILYFQSESHSYKNYKSPCSVPCMSCCPCLSCRLHSHIVLLLKEKKIQTQIKIRHCPLKKKAKLTNAKEMNGLLDRFVAYLNVACSKLLFYLFMNS